MPLRAALLALAMPVAAPALAAEPQAVLTLLEGDATLVVGARAYAAAVGARLNAGVLVETDVKASLLRLEWPDGTVLDLGPATRVMLRPPALAAGKPAPYYLLQGWAKQSQTAVAPGPLSLAFEVHPFKGVLVSQVEGSTAVSFAETGDMQFIGRRNGLPLTVRAGQVAVLGSDGVAQGVAQGLAQGVAKVQARPPAGWLPSNPRAFRDTLAPRAAQFKSAPPALKARAPLSYAALQPWLTAEAALRRDFPTRFAELLRDREFYAAINSRIAQHPEWEPVLRPPHQAKPKPKPKSDPAAALTVATDPEPPR